MNIQSAERGLLITFDARLVPSSSSILHVGGCAVFLLSLVFGGGTKQGLWSDALIEIAALPVLFALVFGLRSCKFDSVSRYALLLALVALLVPLLQLIPLPPWIWHSLPGRSPIAAELHLIAADQSWQPLTLAPRECWLMFLSMLPPLATFLVTLQLDKARRRMMVLLFLAWTCAGIGLDLAQVLGGPGSSLRFYTETNVDRAVGFFANANHNALASCLAVPFLLLVGFNGPSARINASHAVLAASMLIAAVIAVALTHSRAGVGLMFLALALAGALVLGCTTERHRRKQYVVIGLCLAAFVTFVAFQIGFVALSDRFQAPLSDDLRWGLLHVTYNAALQYFPVGSGLGSFVSIYERFAPLQFVHETYVNHAHNDWIELFLELGVLWPIVVLGFIVWVGVAARHQWRACASLAPIEILACLMALLLIALASVMDYPLRTVGLMSVFAVLCAFLNEPLSKKDSRGS